MIDCKVCRGEFWRPKMKLHILFALVAAMIAAPATVFSNADRIQEDFGQAYQANKKVKELFAGFRDGENRATGKFPKLDAFDIPALLQIAKSDKLIRNFPRNPLSSQYERQCSEGMVALWLIEGIRKSDRPTFPSLNALCLPRDKFEGDWTTVSQNQHKVVLQAYQDWWKDADPMDMEKSRKTNPLDGTNLHWH